MKKQLIIVSDMEGASGIFDENREAIFHGSDLWASYGRDCMTSDVLAVCEAANACGIEDILYYDGHFAGMPEFNTKLEKLPGNVRVFDTPDRCFFWRRIRGQAQMQPFGIITVGQHARYGEPDAYFAHTIQSPPIRSLYVNGIHVAEIGMAVLSFDQTPYLANIGCAASMKEARELSPTITCIPVKDKGRGWEPSPAETYPLIVQGVTEAIQGAAERPPVAFEEPCVLSMELMDGFCFAPPPHISWKGSFTPTRAEWEAPTVAIGLELFNDVRTCITKA